MKFSGICSSSCRLASALLVITILYPTSFLAAQSGDSKKYDLNVGKKVSTFNVDTKLEAKGMLVMDPTKETRTVSMNVLANYRYEERLGASQGRQKSIRYYNFAKSRAEIGHGIVNFELNDDNRYLILERSNSVQADGKRISYQTPKPTLTNEELDLVITPANSMVLTKWIAKQDVAVDEQWKTDSGLLADVLGWDLVDDNQVFARIKDINSSSATILLTGEAMGDIDGAAAKMTVKGSLSFNRRDGYVSGIRLKLAENRDASPVQPGYEATIWMESTITPDRAGVRLTNAELGKLKMDPSSNPNQLVMTTKCGPYSMIHPRHWRVISDREDRTVLRCIRNGRVLGQCDIIPLSDHPAGVPNSLDLFKRNVENAISSNGGRVINAQQSPSLSRNQWMRIDADGTSNEIDMRWIYFTMISPDNRRVQLLFTLEQELASEFNGFEMELLDAVQFNAVAPTTEGEDVSATLESSSRKQ